MLSEENLKMHNNGQISDHSLIKGIKIIGKKISGEKKPLISLLIGLCHTCLYIKYF